MSDVQKHRLPQASEKPSLQGLQTRVAEVYQGRCVSAAQSYLTATDAASRAWLEAAQPADPVRAWTDAVSYWSDFTQRSILFWDTLRQRGNNWLAHEKAGKPPLLAFEWEIVADARSFAHPCNYALVRIEGPPGTRTDPDKRPYIIIDPRAGHGPGIGGFKPDSEVGVALRAGHPVYAVIFFPDPVEGQTLADVSQAEAEFLRIVRSHHPTRGKPVIVGNCQGGWAAMLVGALDPDNAGPIVVNGAPMSYWAGNDAENPMRYAGGMLGGSWTALLASDLGGGTFDGAYLVDNFEALNPANTFFGKTYNLFAKIDTEPERYLEFERWWGGYFLMNREEIKWIVDNLFLGNKLAAGSAEWSKGSTFDLRAIRSPIILFASLGDNITPPQQAFNWVADLYPTTKDLKANGQVIVGLMHESIGHLGIFVSASVARREHAQIVDLLEYIEHLPPGLYGMQVEERGSNGATHYDVVLKELQVEDLQQLQKYARKDEVPFAAVEKVSEFNASLYETFVHPVLGALVTPEAGKVARACHPLRARRWAISNLNPFLAPLKGWADFARAHRMPRDETGPSVATERLFAASVTASWDLYRQLRDATAENLFYNVYGTMSVVAPEMPQVAKSELQPSADAPSIRDAPARMEEGGFTEAAVRAALLAARLGAREKRLSTAKRIRELVGREVGMLDLAAGEASQIVRQQSYIVEQEPERALATLPMLVRTAEERRRLLSILERLTDQIDLAPEQRALMSEVERLLAAAPGPSPAPSAAPLAPRRQAAHRKPQRLHR
jgi:pimeloyl-ACP methyl ester carboxylesterase